MSNDFLVPYSTKQQVLFPCPLRQERLLWWKWSVDGHEYKTIGYRPRTCVSWYNLALCKKCGRYAEFLEFEEK